MISKFRTILITLIFLSLCISNLKAQTSFIKEVNYSENNKMLIIPFKEFKLDNGLTVIIHEDDSDPLVHVDITIM